MALDSYGVVIGAFDHFDRDDSNHYGNFFHGHIFVRVPATGGSTDLYNCAVDVKFPSGHIEYFHPTSLDASKFTAISSRADGYYDLARDSTSGALDYLRNPFISLPLGCLAVVLGFLNLLDKGNRHVWENNVGSSALNTLEQILTASDITRVYVFGAHYVNQSQNPPQGLHDVHYNQGDPPGSFQHLDAIWQDGGVVIQHSDGRLEGFFVKFTTQSLRTDNNGLPLP